MADKLYKVGNVSVKAPDLGNVFVQWYTNVDQKTVTLNEVAKQIEGSSPAYLKDIMTGKKVVDDKHAAGLAKFFKKKAMKEQVDKYLVQYASGNDIDVEQSKEIKSLAEGLYGIVKVGVENKKGVAKNKTDIASANKKIKDLEGEVEDCVGSDDLTKAKADLRKGYRKEISDAVKPLATTSYVDKKLKEGEKETDPKAFKLLDEADAILKQCQAELKKK